MSDATIGKTARGHAVYTPNHSSYAHLEKIRMVGADASQLGTMARQAHPHYRAVDHEEASAMHYARQNFHAARAHEAASAAMSKSMSDDVTPAFMSQLAWVYAGATPDLSLDDAAGAIRACTLNWTAQDHLDEAVLQHCYADGLGDDPKKQAVCAAAAFMHFAAADVDPMTTGLSKALRPRRAVPSGVGQVAEQATLPLPHHRVKKSGVWAENQHPRAGDGEFQNGSGGSNGKRLTSTGKPIHAAKPASDALYAKFLPADHLEAGDAHRAQSAHAYAAGDKANGAAQMALANGHVAAWGVKTKLGTTKHEAVHYTGANLTQQEAAAVSAYVGTQNDDNTHHAINATASGRDAPTDPAQRAKNIKTATHLQAAIGKQTLSADATLYRGFDGHIAGKVGAVISQGGFTSATTDKSIADEFSFGRGSGQTGGSGKRTIITIRAPKGTHAVEVAPHVGGVDPDKEHIFAAHQQFKITGKKVKKNVHLIEMEAVPAPVGSIAVQKGGAQLQVLRKTLNTKVLTPKVPRKPALIGMTRSNKPIFDVQNHPAHKGFDAADHMDAVRALGQRLTNQPAEPKTPK